MAKRSTKNSKKINWYREALRDPQRYGLLTKIRRNVPLKHRHVQTPGFKLKSGVPERLNVRSYFGGPSTSTPKFQKFKMSPRSSPMSRMSPVPSVDSSNSVSKLTNYYENLSKSPSVSFQMTPTKTPSSAIVRKSKRLRSAPKKFSPVDFQSRKSRK